MFLVEVQSYPYHAVVRLLVLFCVGGGVKLILLMYVFLSTETNNFLVTYLERLAMTICLRVNPEFL